MPERARDVIVVLDNEAVQSLVNERHPKHRRLLAEFEALAVRRTRGSARSSVLVPTSVRVEAGWDRTNPATARLNRFRVRDHGLDGTGANRAASIRLGASISVADAHVGVAVQDAALVGQVVVFTSDPADIMRAAAPVHPDIRRV